MGPLSGRVVDSHVSFVEVDTVQLFDAQGGLFGSGHLDESETTGSAGLSCTRERRYWVGHQLAV
jgi:hypothetical protein